MTVTKLRMTALAPTTKRGFVVGILASLKECRTNIIGAISLGRSQYPKGAKTRFIAPRTGSSNPFPSSGESGANLSSSIGGDIRTGDVGVPARAAVVIPGVGCLNDPVRFLAADTPVIALLRHGATCAEAEKINKPQEPRMSHPHGWFK